MRKFNIEVSSPVLHYRGLYVNANMMFDRKYPPCRRACPAGVNVQAYIALVTLGKFTEALEMIRRAIPFPSVCGRVCFSPCEDACTRNNLDAALSIRLLKRLVADASKKIVKPKITPKTRIGKVAIIGSGPSGLTAAFELAKRGYLVTVYESSTEPGGCLRYCIPEYRLPQKILQAEIDFIKESGVDIVTNKTIGKDITIKEIVNRGYNAVFIATGVHKCIPLNIVGEELDGVHHALNFLKNIRTKCPVDLGDKVAVIGGGNVAIDTARTAKRLGNTRVTILYRRSEEEMPAHRPEIEAAKQEGIDFRFLVSPRKILGQEGKVSSIECVENVLGNPDDSGRRRPVPVDGSEFIVPADSVLIAIGEIPATTFLPRDVEVTKRNRIVADKVTLETTVPGVFAGGDAVTGPASVIEAIAAGKRAAESIDRYIKGQDLKTDRTEEVPETSWVSEENFLEKKEKQAIKCLKPEERINSFIEVELGLENDAGILEARRCLFCGPCEECLDLEVPCPADDIFVDEEKCIACANCARVCEYGALKISEATAKVDPFLCKGCGTCVVECPAEAIHLKEFSDEKISDQINRAAFSWKGTQEPQIVAFICNWAYKPEDFKPLKNLLVIPLKCIGRIDPLHVLHAFMKGVDGVLIIGCEENDCHFIFGGYTARNRFEKVKSWLQTIGIHPERFKTTKSSVGKEKHLNEVLENFKAKLKTIETSIS